MKRVAEEYLEDGARDRISHILGQIVESGPSDEAKRMVLQENASRLLGLVG